MLLDRIHKLLHRLAHRPLSLLDEPWIMAQRWENLLFCHWRVPQAVLRPHIPDDLTIDSFDGSAWISLVPMRMAEIHYRELPGIPGLDNFPEMNLRTYVTHHDRPGVYFLSLDTTSATNVWLARNVFHLPYFQAEQSIDDRSLPIHFTSRRMGHGQPAAEVNVHYQPVGEPFTPGEDSLEHFLSERYAMYTVTQDGVILRGDIEHEPWEMQSAEATIDVNTMLAAYDIPVLDQPPLLSFARSLDVLCWRPVFVSSTTRGA